MRGATRTSTPIIISQGPSDDLVGSMPCLRDWLP